ncbi:hypothetical protein ACHHYP_09256 [Achlya hypogyna]|uniref:Uncharacterized protein n=1 Tax=Achlya hypogyna TaxID=1202772 RepID=A0A1V9ZJ78_ACHHY|nr:hypothetical protein ACHHYP_09256 [Achlya hypogyna]
MLKRTLPPSAASSEYPSKIQILYPRPDATRDDDKGYQPPVYFPHHTQSHGHGPYHHHDQQWAKPSWEPPMEPSHDSGKPMLYPRAHETEMMKNEYSILGKRPWREVEDHGAWAREAKRREDEIYDDAPIAEPVSSPSSSDVLEKEEAEEKLTKAGKKRNRMKDEIDALRKEILTMTKHLDSLKVHNGKPHGKALWADIAKQQEMELGRVVRENQQLRQTLEEHLGIAQDYLDSILPKQAKDVSALPVIMCL